MFADQFEPLLSESGKLSGAEIHRQNQNRPFGRMEQGKTRVVIVRQKPVLDIVMSGELIGNKHRGAMK